MRRGRGRPRVGGDAGGSRVEITLPNADIEWLDMKCHELGVSRAEMIRRLISWWRDRSL